MRIQIMRCNNCGTEFDETEDPEEEECPVCGSGDFELIGQRIKEAK